MSRALPPVYAQRYGNVEPGRRGGVVLAQERALFELCLRPSRGAWDPEDFLRRAGELHDGDQFCELCALVPKSVDGCSITAAYAPLDFHMIEPLDKQALSDGIARLVAEAHPVRHRWISEAELDANPGLVRSMSVQPPRGQGRVRLLEIDGVDLQPCGGTHVANTADIDPSSSPGSRRKAR